MSDTLANRTFDQLQIGERATLSRTLRQEDITLFAAVSHDTNPVHLDAAFAAPRFTDAWPAMRDRLRAILAERRHPSDGYVLIGETAQEREWSEAGRLAGYLAGDRFFAPPPA